MKPDYDFTQIKNTIANFYAMNLIDAQTFSQWNGYLINLDATLQIPGKTEFREPSGKIYTRKDWVAYKLHYLENSLNAKLDEKHAASLSVIIGGTLAGMGKDLLKGAAAIGNTAINALDAAKKVVNNAFSLVGILTNPIVLIIIVIVVIFVFLKFYRRVI